MRVARRHVAIAGAGIAGLTAALAMARAGFHVTIFERVVAPAEIGAGLQLSPNATRILAGLDVLNRLRPLATAPQSVDLASLASGRMLMRLELDEKWLKGMGAPWLVTHRADLHASLLQTALRTHDATVHFGAEVDDVALHARGVTIGIREADRLREMECAALIGADGVWSRVRERITGSATAEPTGLVAWRATADRLPDGVGAERVVAWLGRGAHLITYPLRGGASTNLVAVTRDLKFAPHETELAVDFELSDFAAKLWPGLAPVLKSAGPWRRWPLYAVDPDGPWNEGAVALIGDAAHAMTPFSAQGAAMAIEDAWELAAAFAARPNDAAAAFRVYAETRRPRIKRVARRAAFNRFVYHLGFPMAQARDLAFKLRKPEAFLADLDWLYAYKPTPLPPHPLV